MSGNDHKTIAHLTAADLVIAELAASEADLLEARRQLVALVANLADEILRLRAFADQQYRARVAAEGRLLRRPLPAAPAQDVAA